MVGRKPHLISYHSSSNMKRVCNKCGEYADCYPQRAECKKCTKRRVTDYKRANPEIAKRHTAASAEKNRARVKAWRLANPERDAENHRRTRATNPERTRQYVKDWVARNPERARHLRIDISARRRARKRHNGVGPVDYDELWLIYKGCCYLCGEPITGERHWEHKIPIAEGGPHCQFNLGPSCQPCNNGPGGKWTQIANPFTTHPDSHKLHEVIDVQEAWLWVSRKATEKKLEYQMSHPRKKRTTSQS